MFDDYNSGAGVRQPRNHGKRQMGNRRGCCRGVVCARDYRIGAQSGRDRRALCAVVAGFVLYVRNGVYPVLLDYAAGYFLDLGIQSGRLAGQSVRGVRPDERGFAEKGEHCDVPAGGGGFALFAVPRREISCRQSRSIASEKIDYPFKIVLVSDLHINPAMPVKRVKKIVETVNALKPDVIVLPGDIVDAKPDEIAEQTAELAKLNAKYGAL